MQSAQATRLTKPWRASGAAGGRACCRRRRSRVALFVLGGFLIATSNLDRLGTEWSSAAELSVYLEDDVTPAERGRSKQRLAPGDIVAGHEFVSKPDALGRFKQTFTDLAGTVDSLGDNPLPASYEVRLPIARRRPTSTALAAKLRQTAGRRRRALRPPVAGPSAVGRRPSFAAWGSCSARC